MKIAKTLLLRAVMSSLALLIIVSLQPASAQEERPVAAPALITLAEAQAIIDGAVAFSRERNMMMAVVVLDQSGYVVSSARMDGAPFRNTHFAEGKAFASAITGRTSEALGELANDRPDRYFGMMNMYPGKVYLAGGGVPLSVDGTIVGAVGVSGLPQGIDEMASRAGMTAWETHRANGGE
jgi:glc operon protein GlcG